MIDLERLVIHIFVGYFWKLYLKERNCKYYNKVRSTDTIEIIIRLYVEEITIKRDIYPYYFDRNYIETVLENFSVNFKLIDKLYLQLVITAEIVIVYSL